MKGRTTLILLGVLTLLAAYIYFVEIRGKAEKTRTEEKSKKLLSMENTEIQSISVTRASDSFECEKNLQEDWHLLSPVEDLADKSNMAAMASSLADMKIEREDPNAQSLSDFGLEPPMSTVIAVSKTGKRDTLYFGDKNPTGTFLYARKAGEKRVVLTSNSIQTYLTKPIFDIRDKSILPFEKNDVERIQMTAPGGNWVLARTGGVWNLLSPVKARADENAVDSFLNQFLWAKAKEYAEENPKSLVPYGLSRPAMVLTLTMGADKSQKILSLGKLKGKDRIYGKDSGRSAVFLADTSLLREFKKTAFELRDKKIVFFQTDSVRSIEVSYPDRPALICRKDTADNWLIESPKKAKAISFKINTILNDIRDLQAKDFLGESGAASTAYGLNHPRAKALFKDRNGVPLAEVWVGKSTGKNQLTVWNVRTKSLFKADDAFMKNLKPEIDDIVEKEPEKPAEAKTADIKNEKSKIKK